MCLCPLDSVSGLWWALLSFSHAPRNSPFVLQVSRKRLLKSFSALCFSAKVGAHPWPPDPQVCRSGCVDLNIADFDGLGRDPLVGGGLSQIVSGGSERGDCVGCVG